MSNPFEIIGERELAAKLRALGTSLSAPILEEAVDASLDPVLAEARQNAPVAGEKYATGTIREELERVFERRGENWVVKGIGIDDAGKSKDRHRAHILFWLEFGTVHMPARPILRPAFYDNRGAAEALIRNHARTRVLSAARG